MTPGECGTVLWEAKAAGGVGAVSPPAEPAGSPDSGALTLESCWEMERSRSGAVRQ